MKKKVTKKKKVIKKKATKKRETKLHFVSVGSEKVSVICFILRKLNDYRSTLVPPEVNPVTIAIPDLDEAIFYCEAMVRILSK